MKKEFKIISKIIQNNKRVLDVGCGDGTLMEHLKFNQQNDVRGLEPIKDLVQKCISRGLSVIEGDAENNTPNLHMCTIKDFVNFCEKKNIIIDKSLCLTNEKISEITNNNMFYKNILSQLGIFIIK